VNNWDFYLHNIKGLSLGKSLLLKKNISACLSALKLSSLAPEKKDRYTRVLEDAESVFERAGDRSNADEDCRKAKERLLKILDEWTGEHFSTDSITSPIYSDPQIVGDGSTASKSTHNKSCLARRRIGLNKAILLHDEEYDELLKKREEYMQDALELKEQMERKNVEDDDEDDDDEDETGKDDKADRHNENGTEKGSESKQRTTRKKMLRPLLPLSNTWTRIRRSRQQRKMPGLEKSLRMTTFVATYRQLQNFSEDASLSFAHLA
jgi:hypothetical protein